MTVITIRMKVYQIMTHKKVLRFYALTFIDQNEQDNDENKHDMHEVNSNDEGEGESKDEGCESEEIDGDPNELAVPLKSKGEPSQKHEYSEVEDNDDEVFELPSNSESFKAGTIFRASNK